MPNLTGFPRLLARVRWRIAYAVGSLRGQCWADLVPWALDGPLHERRVHERSVLPWRPSGRICREYADREGSCYCGKFRDSDGFPEVSP